MSDEEIMSLCLGGDYENAFNGLVHSYSERLYWHLRSFVSIHEDADDLLQEVLIKIWNALPRFRGEAHLYTWLYRIATNEALNSLRRQKLKNMLSLSSDDSVFASRLEADPYFNGDELQRQLLAAVRKLPEKQRLVFVMRYFEDMDYRQISEILNTSEGALKASYHHACMKIRNEIPLHF